LLGVAARLADALQPAQVGQPGQEDRGLADMLLPAAVYLHLGAFLEVEDALVKNRTSEERILLLNDQIIASSNALRLSTYRYIEGLSDYLPVLAAQQSLYESESALLSAKRQLISDRVQLARALGGEWMAAYIEERLTAEKVEENTQ